MDDRGKPLAVDRLTQRELEILQLVADGLSNQDLTERLFITRGTVKWYLRQIYGKLHVGSRTQAVAAARAAGVLDETSASVEPSRPLHNLPQQVTPCIGREAELAQIARLLGDPAIRLVTILGPGGIGKTRLALEEGATQLGRFRDGVYLANLAPLSEPNLIPSVIASAVGLSLAPSQPLINQLLNYVRDKQMLLVLDNIEHLLTGVDLLLDLLQIAPGLKMLVTSRERLQLQAEVVFRLDGLPFKDWTTLDEAMRSGAGRLFLQMARRARPSFELTPDSLSDLSTVCRLVNGMPLGILLAAAWADTLSIAEIAREIQHSFEFLEGELRDLPVRQRSLRAVFEQSWGHLNQAERSAMCHLSVFSGGFTREAAELVGAVSLKTLISLVNKSLLGRGHSGRFEMHELLRQYSARELARLPAEGERLEARHAAYYADFMDKRWSALHSARMNVTADDIEPEIDNVRTAWHFMIRHARLSPFAKTARVLWWYLEMRSQFEEGIEMFGNAISQFRALPASEERDVTLGEALLGLGHFVTLSGFPASGKALTEESLKLLEEYDAAEVTIRAYIPLCLSEFLLGDYQALKRHAEQAVALAEHIEDPWYRCGPVYFLGLAALGLGEHEEANHAGTEALGYAEQSGDLYLQGACYGLLLGRTAVRTGRYDEAKRYYLYSITYFEKIGHGYYTALLNSELSEVCTLMKDFDAAKRAYQKSLDYFSKVGPVYLIFPNLRSVAR